MTRFLVSSSFVLKMWSYECKTNFISVRNDDIYGCTNNGFCSSECFFHEDRICLLKLHEINNLLSVFTETVKLLTNTVTEVCRA